MARLGYTYLPRHLHSQRSESSNIFPTLFQAVISKINPQASETEINLLLDELELKLNFEDLGKDFFK